MATWTNIYEEKDTNSVDRCYLCKYCVYEMSVKSKICLQTKQTLTEEQVYNKVYCDKYKR